MTDRELAKRLRETGGLDPMMVLEAADAIERLLSERDWARREICDLATPRDYAELRGWDCFEEAP